MNVNLILEAINQKDIKSSGQVLSSQGQSVKEGNDSKFSFFRDLIMKKLVQNNTSIKCNTDMEAVNVNSISMLFLASQLGMLNNNSPADNNISGMGSNAILPENINERLKEVLPEVMSYLQDFIKSFSGQLSCKNIEDLKTLFSEKLPENINIQNISPELSAIFQSPEFRTDIAKLLQNPEFKANMTDFLQDTEIKTNMTDLLKNVEIKTIAGPELSANQIYNVNIPKSSDITNVLNNGINPADKNTFDNLLVKIKDSLAGIVNMAENSENNNISQGEIFSKYPFLHKLSEFIGKIEDFQKNSQSTSEGLEQLSTLFDKSLSLLSTLEKISKEFAGMGNKENKNDNRDLSNMEMTSKNIDALDKEGVNISGETGNISSLQNKTPIENNIIDVKTEIHSPVLNDIDLSDQIVKKIDWKVTKNLSEATITLEPEYLGKLRVELQVAAGGEVSARFFAQTKESGDILLQQLNQLKNSLAEQGLKLGSFSVFTQDSPSSGFQNFLSYNNSGGRNYSPSNEDVKETFVKPAVKVKTSQMDYLV